MDKTRLISTVETTCKIIGNVLAGISQQEAATWRDGDDGWTVLEVLCHLRDFDGFFYERAAMMVERDYPQLPAYDHEALAIERRYNEQNMQQVYCELVESRARFRTFLAGLTNEQWKRSGMHPERGHFTMVDALVQVVTHDITHLEQITRIVGEKQ